jgi:hypothetical protein
LLKSARLLGQFHLPDISHAIGTCLRKVFKKYRLSSYDKTDGAITTQDIKNTVKLALEDIFMAALCDWRVTHSSVNQALKRKLFFYNRA